MTSMFIYAFRSWMYLCNSFSVSYRIKDAFIGWPILMNRSYIFKKCCIIALVWHSGPNLYQINTSERFQCMFHQLILILTCRDLFNRDWNNRPVHTYGEGNFKSFGLLSWFCSITSMILRFNSSLYRLEGM